MNDGNQRTTLVTARKGEFDAQQEKDRYPRLDAIPFESQHQYMATLHRGDSPVVYLKGSVERILTRCDSTLGPGGEKGPLDADVVHAQVEAMASQGQRVLAFEPREPGIMRRPPRRSLPPR